MPWFHTTLSWISTISIAIILVTGFVLALRRWYKHPRLSLLIVIFLPLLIIDWYFWTIALMIFGQGVGSPGPFNDSLTALHIFLNILVTGGMIWSMLGWRQQEAVVREPVEQLEEQPLLQQQSHSSYEPRRFE